MSLSDPCGRAYCLLWLPGAEESLYTVKVRHRDGDVTTWDRWKAHPWDIVPTYRGVLDHLYEGVLEAMERDSHNA